MKKAAPVVLVTGASSGIGAASGALLAERGFQVVGASRATPTAGAPFHHLVMDVRDEEAVGRGVAAAEKEYGPLAALVLCAGYGCFGSVEETTLEAARAQFETNFFGTLNPIRAALPGMRERRAGRIVIVGSLAGRAPIPFQSHYSATKAALDALSLSLRNEVAPFGIGVSLIEPGDIRTGFNDRMDWGPRESSPYGERALSCERVIRDSLPSAPPPEVVAKTVLRALLAKRPRVRYTVGPDSLMVPLGRRLLPDFLSLELIRSHFKV